MQKHFLTLCLAILISLSGTNSRAILAETEPDSASDRANFCSDLFIEALGIEENIECQGMDRIECNLERLDGTDSSNFMTEEQFKTVHTAIEEKFTNCMNEKGKKAKEECEALAEQAANDLISKYICENLRIFLTCKIREEVIEVEAENSR